MRIGSGSGKNLDLTVAAAQLGIDRSQNDRSSPTISGFINVCRTHASRVTSLLHAHAVPGRVHHAGGDSRKRRAFSKARAAYTRHRFH
jgi:hypothetical protein